MSMHGVLATGAEVEVVISMGDADLLQPFELLVSSSSLRTASSSGFCHCFSVKPTINSRMERATTTAKEMMSTTVTPWRMRWSWAMPVVTENEAVD